MTEPVNPSLIYERAKAHWTRTEAPKRDIQDMFDDLRILLFFAAFVAMATLSSSHTIDAFRHNVPLALAYVAPLAFELYLIASTLAGRSVHVHFSTRLTQVLIFIVAVIANGASGWEYASATSSDSMRLVWQAQALIAAAIVPSGTMSIGHHVALLIQSRQRSDKVGDAWKLVEALVFYRALYTVYNGQGLSQQESRRMAQADVQGYLSAGRIGTASRPSLVSLPDRTGQDVPVQKKAVQQDAEDSTGGTLADRAYAMLEADPSLYSKSVRVLADETGIGKNHWSYAKRRYQQLQDTQPMEAQVVSAN